MRACGKSVRQCPSSHMGSGQAYWNRRGVHVRAVDKWQRSAPEIQSGDSTESLQKVLLAVSLTKRTSTGMASSLSRSRRLRVSHARVTRQVDVVAGAFVIAVPTKSGASLDCPAPSTSKPTGTATVLANDAAAAHSRSCLCRRCA